MWIEGLTAVSPPKGSKEVAIRVQAETEGEEGKAQTTVYHGKLLAMKSTVETDEF